MKFHGFKIVTDENEDDFDIDDTDEHEINIFDEITEPGTHVVFRGRFDRFRDGGQLVRLPCRKVFNPEPK
jgi:hypothetical protein